MSDDVCGKPEPMTSRSVVTPATSGDGRDSRYCGAKKRQGEGCCKRPAGWGTDHVGAGRCKLHGGSTSSGRIAAQNEQIAAEVQRLGLTVETTPVAALQDALNRAQSDVLVLGWQVQAMDPESWIERELLAGGGSRREVSPWLRAYWQGLDRLAAISAKCVSLNIEAAAASVMQRHGEEIVTVLYRVLAAFDLTPSEAHVAEVVRRELLAIDGGAAA